MKSPGGLTLVALLIAALFPGPAEAHIGSPNVFFEGAAGPHRIRVVVRPPGTLPGLAQVDVKLADGKNATVTLRSVFVNAGAGAAIPPPIPASPVPGDPHRFTATVPLIHSGSHRLEIEVNGPRSSGSVVVPLQASATRIPSMQFTLRIALVALGVLLFASAVVIARAAVAIPQRRMATVISSLLLTAAVGAGAMRWQVLDRRFRTKAIAEAVPVEATVISKGTHHLLRLTPTTERAPLTRWGALVTDHGKLMHLFLVRSTGMDAFAHLHPVRRDPLTFENLLPNLPAGAYDLYGELAYESGVTETVIARVELPSPTAGPIRAITTTPAEYDAWCRGAVTRGGYSAEPIYLDPDDSWSERTPEIAASFANLIATLPSGHRLVFHGAGNGLLEMDRDADLRFSIFSADGAPAEMQPFMGMRAHAAVRSRDGKVFAHLHPSGSISMAAQAVVSGNAGASGDAPEPPFQPRNEVTLPYAFPRAGVYRIWVQVRVEAKIETAVFEVTVGEK